MATTKETKAPGFFEIFFGATLSVTLGALLAVLHVISRPVEIVREVPKEPVPGVRYSLEGGLASAGGNKWKIKSERMVDKMPGDYAFSDAELNAWASVTYKKIELEKDAEVPSFALLTGVPNFRLNGSLLQITTANDLLLLGGTGKLVIEARGSMVKSDEGWRYVPSEFYLGGLPAHKIPALTSLLVSRLASSSADSPELNSVLKNASAMTIAGGSLVVRLP